MVLQIGNMYTEYPSHKIWSYRLAICIQNTQVIRYGLTDWQYVYRIPKS